MQTPLFAALQRPDRRLALLLTLAYQPEKAVEWWRHTPPIWIGDG